MTYNGVTQIVVDFLLSITTDPLLFMAIVALALLFIGMVMDATVITITLAPLLAPVAKIYAIPDIQFALVFVLTVVIGLVTPPVGIVLFMVSTISKVTLERLSVAIIPFVIWMIIVVGLMILIPDITLWLPRYLGLAR